jgi:hypothetical protein
VEGYVTEPSAASTYEGFDESAVARIIDDLATRFSWEGWSGYDVVRVGTAGPPSSITSCR